MKHVFLVFLVFASILVKAQSPKGIAFQHGLTWTEIKEKAKKENRYIFIDGHTTWCVPCHEMEQDIFPLENVGEFFNVNFINVSLQFDRTEKDNPEVKAWYKNADFMKGEYQIDSYPTYLFFEPNGNLVHKVLGSSSSADEFIAKAKEALSPDKQYYVLKNQYEAGIRDSASLSILLKTAKKLNDSNFIPIILKDYLAGQPNLYKPEVLNLLASSTSKTTDPSFLIFRENSEKVDSVLGEGKSEELIMNIVTDELIVPLLRKDGTVKRLNGGGVIYTGTLEDNVNWDEVSALVNSKYPEVAEQAIMAAKPLYYQWTKMWPEFSASVNEYLEKYAGTLNKDFINSYAWTILMESDDKPSMESAIRWSGALLSSNSPWYFHTYSNLLYKSGEKQKAIKFLEGIIADPKTTHKKLGELLEKMKNDEKTW